VRASNRAYPSRAEPIEAEMREGTAGSMLQTHPEVAAALAGRRSVVALESTIVAHGLPWPENLEVGREMEDTVRRHGAIPATIAVIDGVARVGLAPQDLERLARAGGEFVKAGAADLAVALARGTSAATTVSATCVLAVRAGIQVFATGGIGGVHRGDAGDVSSDLVTIARNRIAVVSAGAKAILDLPRTLEWLDTLGVLVLGYGTSEFPAFYTRESGLPLEHRVDTPVAVARILAARWELGQGGVLIANPIPPDAALDRVTIESAIDDASVDAASRGVRGKALTPYLLAHLARITAGASVRANRALALNNARVGAGIAAALAGL
jgi:pseudouridine-5'-phosphate glycosidase